MTLQYQPQSQPLPQLDESARRDRRFAAGGVAIVASFFCAMVSIALLGEVIDDISQHPLQSQHLVTLQAKAAAEPDNQALRDDIRLEDLRIRHRYFIRRDFYRRGAIMLACGLAVLALSVKLYYRYAEKLPMPSAAAPAPLGASAGRWAVGLGGVASAATLVLIAFLPTRLPRTLATNGQGPGTIPGAVEKPVELPPPPTTVTAEMLKQAWPVFRGPDSGRAIGAYPIEFDGQAGTNILWKTELPAMTGRNSPVVFAGRIFLSGATAKKREVWCFDAATGRLAWRQVVSQSNEEKPEKEKISEDTTYAPNTLATDGMRVYATFPSGDIAAFDLNGRKLWGIDVGVADNLYGHATSLLAWKDRVIVQIDQAFLKDKKSAIFALDGQTGKELWRTPRETPMTWASPILIDTPNGPQVITLGEPFVIAYNPADGKEIWRAKGMSGEIAPSPAYANGIVYAGVERADLMPIPADGTGDVSGKVPWRGGDDLPDVVSLLTDGKRLLTVTAIGRIAVVDASDGKLIWDMEFGDARFDASPVLANGLVYLPDKVLGDVYIVPIETGAWVARAPMGEAMYATPAFVDGRIYLRTEKHLYCIGPK